MWGSERMKEIERLADIVFRQIYQNGSKGKREKVHLGPYIKQNLK